MYERTLYVPAMYIPVYSILRTFGSVFFFVLVRTYYYLVVLTYCTVQHNSLYSVRSYGAGVDKKRAHILYVSNTYEVTSRSTTSMVAQ